MPGRRHSYYRLQFELQSPMCIAGDIGEYTDRDVLTDSLGRPYIPGSSIAGLLRSMLSEQEADSLFGYAREEQAVQSVVCVHDACPEAGKAYSIVERDNVSLNEYRVALEDHKFDAQYVDTGAVFVGLLELSADAPQDSEQLLKKALSCLQQRGCGFGGKYSRGMGRAKLTIAERSFDLSKEEELKAWLAFDPFTPEAFKGAEEPKLPVTDDGALRIGLKLSLKGALSVRVYTAEPKKSDKDIVPDYVTQTSGGLPVVPGTSWAGAFRHRYAALCGNALWEQALFGTTEYAAALTFSETRVEGGVEKLYTRNAIDRFSGKVKDGALFTERTHYGGTGALTLRLEPAVLMRNLLIELKKKEKPADADETKEQRLAREHALIERAVIEAGKARGVLGALLCDLYHGYLAVGGLTSVGHGCFTVESLELDEGEYLLDGTAEKARDLIKAVVECRPCTAPAVTKQEKGSKAAKKADDGTDTNVTQSETVSQTVEDTPLMAVSLPEAWRTELQKLPGAACYIAVQTDRVVCGTYEPGAEPKLYACGEVGVDPARLLQLRIFNEEAEFRACRDSIGNAPWRLRVKRDTDPATEEYYDEKHYLDIDSRCTRTLGNGYTGFRTTGGGAYTLPVPATTRFVKVRSYLAEDERGIQYIADWRVLGFADANDGKEV